MISISTNFIIISIFKYAFKTLYIFQIYNFPLYFPTFQEVTWKVWKNVRKWNVFTSCLKNPVLFLGETLGFFISSCFHFFLFWFFNVFDSSDVFIVNCIFSFHCFFTVCQVLRCSLVTASTTDLRERFLLSGIFYIRLLPAFIKDSLGLAVLLWRLQGFPLRFETQAQPICLNYTVFDNYGTLFKLIKICW